MRGAKGVEQCICSFFATYYTKYFYDFPDLPNTLPMLGSGCLSFMARACDNIIVVLTSAHSFAQQSPPQSHSQNSNQPSPTQPPPNIPSFTGQHPPLSPNQNSPQNPSLPNQPPTPPPPPTDQQTDPPQVYPYNLSPFPSPQSSQSKNFNFFPNMIDEGRYQFVIGSGNNSITILKRSVAPNSLVVCATSTIPQAVVSPLVWDTYLSLC